MIFTGGFTAFGDFVMLSSCIKTLNRQFPELLIDVTHSDPDILYRWVDILSCIGARFAVVPYGNEKTVPYSYVMHHPHYWRWGHGLYQGEQFLKLLYEDILSVMGWFRGPPEQLDPAYCIVDSSLEAPKGDFVVVPGADTPVGPKSAGKQWDGFERLVGLLSEHWPVYELDTAISQRKTYPASAGVVSDYRCASTAKLLRAAKFTVCLEDGLNHWACHNGAKTYCLFKKVPLKPTPAELSYPTQNAITLYDREDPEYVYGKILEGEGLAEPVCAACSVRQPEEVGETKPEAEDRAPFIPPLLPSLT